MRTWLVVGVEKNWQTALAQPIPLWGLVKTYSTQFAILSRQDFLVLYCTSPVKGCIGVGRVLDTYIDEKTCLWQEEIATGKVKWPLRFRFEPVHLLDPAYWDAAKTARPFGPVSIGDFSLNWRVGFQELAPEVAAKILSRITERWEVALETGATIVSPPEPLPSQPTAADMEPTGIEAHRFLQNVIAEAGSLQHFFSQMEYPVELPNEIRRLDVVWKRESQGVPAFAFEVEMSRNVEKSISKLKVAYTRWNSAPRLIVPREQIETVKYLATKEDASFRDSFVCIDPDIIKELLHRKKDLHDFERATRIL